MTNIRESLIQMERVLTRRAFFVNVIKGASAVAVYDRFGPKIFGDPVADPLSRAYEKEAEQKAAYNALIELGVLEDENHEE